MTRRFGTGTRNGVQIRTPRKIWVRSVKIGGFGACAPGDKRSMVKFTFVFEKRRMAKSTFFTRHSCIRSPSSEARNWTSFARERSYRSVNSTIAIAKSCTRHKCSENIHTRPISASKFVSIRGMIYFFIMFCGLFEMKVNNKYEIVCCMLPLHLY